MRARERFLSARDVMEILGVGKTKAYEIMMMFQVRGQGYKVGRSRKIRESDLNNWIKSECFQPIPYTRGKRRSA
ncbi:MAG: helix-turn-helix domain-containing protein [Clostridiales bacterium]|nr:helix-turn-helix domain-containing protein [Clostridiales bacterium]